MGVAMMRVLKGAAILLIGSGVILTVMQFKENSIECYTPNELPRVYVNSVCINGGLYTTSKDDLDAGWTGVEKERTYYPAYRYLWIFLILLGLIALLPLKFVDSKTLPSILKEDSEKKRRDKIMTFIFQKRATFRWAFFCRHFLAILTPPLVLSFIILSLNCYLKGQFLTLTCQDDDSFQEIFPKFAGCDVPFISRDKLSLNVEGAVCELLQSDFSRKIFTVFWYFLMPALGLAILTTICQLVGMFTPSIWARFIALNARMPVDQTTFNSHMKVYKSLGASQALVVLQLRWVMCDMEYMIFINELVKRITISIIDADRKRETV